MTNSDAQLWLEREDSVCREGRIARLNWLAPLAPEAKYWLFSGGLLAKNLFEEARYCFVYGQFLAAIILAMAYIEHTLASLLYAIGRSDLERANISALLIEAVNLGWLDQEEVEKLDRLRIMRNSLTHFRRPGHQGTVEFRSVSEGDIPYTIVEEDARSVMQAAFHVLTKGSV